MDGFGPFPRPKFLKSRKGLRIVLIVIVIKGGKFSGGGFYVKDGQLQFLQCVIAVKFYYHSGMPFFWLVNSRKPLLVFVSGRDQKWPQESDPAIFHKAAH